MWFATSWKTNKRAVVKKLIVDRIREHGPMPFEDFMTHALYDPEGFFGGGVLRSERGGDFLTSPEVSPFFGETLAAHVVSEHERVGDPFVLVEVGAGSGSLLDPLLEKSSVDAVAVDASPAAREKLKALLDEASVYETLEEVQAPFTGVILANELIDNLPMSLAQMVGGAWRERWVGLDGDDLVFVDANPRHDVVRWLDRYSGEVSDGDWVEVQLAAADWLTTAVGALQSGSVVLIDYGDTADGLLPRRGDGTLRTYRAHHLGPHPLDEPGATDITADVNFSALEATARGLGAMTRLLRQEDFLTELGLRERLSSIRRDELAAARSGDDMTRLHLRNQVKEIETLLHPRGLGDFRVLVATV